MKETKISHSEFLKIGVDLLEFVIKKEVKDKINLEKIVDKIFESKVDIIKISSLNTLFGEFSDIEWALVERISLVQYVLQQNKKSESLESIKTVWSMIYSSIQKLEENQVVTSVGSQGFASIVLYKRQDENDIKILRLHIWDISLYQYLKLDDLNVFAIHSHKFHAQSWIFTGEILNTRFFNDANIMSTQNYFEIEWKEENKQWSSFLSNTMRPATLIANRVEQYYNGDSYSIDSGEFHKSGVNLARGIASTLFLFNSDINAVDSSYVLGPNSEKRGPKYEYENFDANQLLTNLNITINDR